MGRVFTIARSEFITAVRARGFLIGIMLMPILFGGAVLLQRVVDQQANGIARHVAVIDDTGELYSRLSEAAAAWNRGERDTGPRVVDGPTFTLEPVTPPADRVALRLALSDRVRAQELFAFVEIPAGPAERRRQRAAPLLLRRPGVSGAARLAAAHGPEGSRQAPLREREGQPAGRRLAPQADCRRGARPARPRHRRLGTRGPAAPTACA